MTLYQSLGLTWRASDSWVSRGTSGSLMSFWEHWSINPWITWWTWTQISTKHIYSFEMHYYTHIVWVNKYTNINFKPLCPGLPSSPTFPLCPFGPRPPVFPQRPVGPGTPDAVQLELGYYHHCIYYTIQRNNEHAFVVWKLLFLQKEFIVKHTQITRVPRGPNKYWWWNAWRTSESWFPSYAWWAPESFGSIRARVTCKKLWWTITLS